MPINHQESNKRLIKNTLTLYLRMILTVGISFYTTRVILDNLGVSDFGLYNLIGGFITMFYMVTSSMSAATSRFITYVLGQDDIVKQKNVFSTSFNLQILLSIVILIIAETIGLWFVNTQLVIETEKLMTANIIYQLAILSFIIELIGIPYYSSIIAHEKIKTFAYVTIIIVVLKLIIALCIAISPINKVVFYAISMMLISLANQLLYFFYCKRHFNECTYHFIYDKSITQQMFSFGGWSFLSSASSMLRGQGVNILLNMFYGTTINAAYGVARQLDSSVKAFSNNFLTALNPQITKSYAAKDKDHTKELIYKGTKFSFILLYIIAFPILMETKILLDLWLVKTPDYSIEFVQLILILALVEVLLKPMSTLNNATGDIKTYQIITSTSQFLVLPICYILLEKGYNPDSVLYITIGAEIVTFIPRIWVNKKYIDISIHGYIKEVILKIIGVIVLSLCICFIISYNLPESFVRLIITISISTIVILISSYFLALNKTERNFIHQIVLRKIIKH